MNSLPLSLERSAKPNPTFMLAAICMGAFVSHFTAGVVNVSLPHLAELFATEIRIVQWITTGYLLVIAALLPLMGKLGDRYGHRRIHNLGYVFFAASSLLVALSPNITLLLAFRMVQAIGAAMFQATNMALVAIHMPANARGRAMGILSTAVALGGMSGPIAGGFIAQWLNWHWLFIVHVPIILAAAWLAYRFIPVQVPASRNGQVDIPGAVSFAAAISFAIIAVSNGNTWGWLSLNTGILFLLAALSMSWLIWRGSTHSSPFLPMNVFRIPAVVSGLAVSFLSFILANTLLVVMPFYMTVSAGFAPAEAGYLLAAYPLALAFTGPLSGRLSDRYGSRPFLFIGLCAMGGGSLLFMLVPDTPALFGIIASLILTGIGMGLIAAPNNSFILRQVPSSLIGTIGGIIALTRNAGMVVGAALGLGLMNDAAGSGEASASGEWLTPFAMNILVSVIGLAILGSETVLGQRHRVIQRQMD
ncbi:MFS transporter [Paenibacillus sp. J2TS4]|uniref:MFS transporter n=1 Tax=Paenibacillus sp. J2TS4 TaxID=2807194 RepID=UPI001B1C0D8C|nr:MFS transporter [Paenibacillus sp. J2TS4]GIP32133.1 MFS transporter [Paenibacillus sp. J2TS4]